MAKHHLAAIAALFAGVPALAFAQSSPTTTVAGLLVTGTRDPAGVSPDQLGGSVTILGPQELEDRQTRIVSDILSDVPGFAVSRQGGVGAFTQVRVRGAESNHLLTLIDGIEASDPFFGEFDYAALLADEVARIEILRGEQSALYGSDAIGGVVNYITPSGASAPGLGGRIEGGSLNTWGAAARLGGVRDGLDYVVSAAHQQSDGFPGQTDGLGTRNLGSDLSAANLKLDWRPMEQVSLRGAVRWSRTAADTDDAPYPDYLIVDTPGMGYVANSLIWSLGGDYRSTDGRWSQSLTLQGLNARHDGLTSFVRDSRSEGGRFKASYAGAFRLKTGEAEHRFTFAADYERETFQNVESPFGADLTRHAIENTGLVGEYDVVLGEQSGGGAALRYDRNDIFDNAVTWRIQAYHRLNRALRLRAAAGSGIKNPSQTELFGYNAAVFPFVGNPNLKPEESRGWEAGADITALDDRARLSATWFQSRLSNEIYGAYGSYDVSPGCAAPPPGASTTCNRASASTREGLELSGDVLLTGAVSLSGAYTWLRAREDGFEEIRRPPQSASLDLAVRPPSAPWGFDVIVRYTGVQQDTNFSALTPATFAGDPAFTVLPSPPNPYGRVELPAFTLVNLTADYALNDKVTIYGRIENLTNTDYYQVITYRSAPRAVYVGVRGRF